MYTARLMLQGRIRIRQSGQRAHYDLLGDNQYVAALFIHNLFGKPEVDIVNLIQFPIHNDSSFSANVQMFLVQIIRAI